MAATVSWLGHNAWSIKTGGATILLDPFLSDSPTAPITADQIQPDYILLSHGHSDHVGDTVAIAKRTGALVVAGFEVTEWLKKKGIDEDKVIAMNPGGGIEQPFGHVKFTTAHHSSSMPDGSYGGVPGGFLLSLPEGRMYFACDTALFLDMKLIAGSGLTLAVLPIGDRYTMGPEDSVEAIKLLNPKLAAPCHYNTWPEIAQDKYTWAQQVRSHTKADPLLLEPGENLTL